MLRTYFQQNEDWFSNSDQTFCKLGEMESEIAELRTISKVTRLRKQIECREEGAWMVVKDVPDDSAPNGSRKVTSYGRTRRSVVRSITSNSDFGNISQTSDLNEPLVEHPSEDNDIDDSKQNSLEITEVFDEPLRGNLLNLEKSYYSDKANIKKKSVVTLGEGNIVLLDPEKESNFHVTGIGKGKVADVVSTLEKTSEKKPKKVGFCKTEVHFAPDSGKINIVETDEKPPPTQVYRRKKRPRATRKGSSCLPKHYFGDVSDLGDDSNFSNESDKEDSRSPGFPPNIEPIPQIKQVFPTFERTIKSESKDVKYRHSSPEKSDSELGIEKLQFDEKDFFRKLKQPAFRERFLKDNPSPSEKKTNVTFTTFSHEKGVGKNTLEKPSAPPTSTTVNGLISRHQKIQEKYSNFSSNRIKEIEVDTDDPKEPELRYTELFKVPVTDENYKCAAVKIHEIKINRDETSSQQNEESDQNKYGFLNKPKSIPEESSDIYSSEPKVPLDQDIKPDVSFLGSMSPKLKSLIQNSVEHEFQLRQKQILQRRTLEKKSLTKDSNKIKSKTNTGLSAQKNKREQKVMPFEETKKDPSSSIITQANKSIGHSKHEFQIKREEITKNMFSEPPYSSSRKELELKEMPYLLSEEPVPAPREKIKPRLESTSSIPPKPKPRTVLSPERPRASKVSTRNTLSRHSMKSDVSSLSKRSKSKESLNRLKELDRTHLRSTHSKDETKLKKAASPKSVEGIQRLSSKAGVQARKISRGEPLRSFEKVSNGWVGVVHPAKKEEREVPKTTVTSRVHSSKALAMQSSHHSSGGRRSTHSGTIRSGQSSVQTGGKGTKQFSLSREHLSSAKLVKELSPSRPTARVRPEVRVVQAKHSSASKVRSYGRLRRDSNDSVIQADEEVRAYMFRSPPKDMYSYPVLRESFYKCCVL